MRTYSKHPPGAGLTPPPSARVAFNIKGACEATGLGRSTLYTLMAEGRLTKVKVNGRTLITAASLLALISGGE